MKPNPAPTRPAPITDPTVLSVDGWGGGLLPRSYLRASLHLALRLGPSHGYDLLQCIHGFGLGSVDLAGLYRALRAMEHDGSVDSRWEPSGLGPSRRVYALTERGQQAAERHLEGLRAARGHLDRMITLSEPPAAPSTGASSP